jgi:hypothetical protein
MSFNKLFQVSEQPPRADDSWVRGCWCGGGVEHRVLRQAGVTREGVEAASRGDDLAGMEHAVQQFADVVVLLIVTAQLPGTQGTGGIFQGRQGQDVYDAEPAGRSLLGRAVGVLFCSQPVDDGGATGRSKDLVAEGFGPWGERVPGGNEQAAADEGAQVEGAVL